MKEERKEKLIYLVDHKIKWETFKKLQEKLVKDSGPTPEHGDRILWEMLKDKQIYCWFGDDWRDDMGVGLKLPEGYKVKVISSK